jgi:hypothetical protein
MMKGVLERAAEKGKSQIALEHMVTLGVLRSFHSQCPTGSITKKMLHIPTFKIHVVKVREFILLLGNPTFFSGKLKSN